MRSKPSTEARYRDPSGRQVLRPPQLVGLNGPWALRRELRRMAEAGLSNFEVLRAATATPAEVLGYDAGMVEGGRVADLLLVHGDARADLAALDAVLGVMIDGRWHPGEELDGRVDAVEASHAAGNAFITAALSHRVDVAVEAHRAAREAGHSNRTSIGVIGYAAAILRGWGRGDDAIALYHLVFEGDPSRASADEGIARALLSQGRTPGAVAALREALRVDPSSGSARELLTELGGDGGSGPCTVLRARRAAGDRPVEA